WTDKHEPADPRALSVTRRIGCVWLASGTGRRGGPPDPPPAYAMGVDLGAVKAAATPELVKCAVGAALTARGPAAPAPSTPRSRLAWFRTPSESSRGRPRHRMPGASQAARAGLIDARSIARHA